MKNSNVLFKIKLLSQAINLSFIFFVYTIGFFCNNELKAQYFNNISAKSFINGNDSLVVYSDVPGLTSSDKFTIRVRSAATNNVWINVFAHYTYNRALEIPDNNMLSGPTPGGNSATSVQHYPNATAGWSQTYGNIEMSRNQPIEVEIAAKNGFKIDGQDFYKATVHPSQKASVATIVNGKVYFTITEPVQVAIDINGQMDEHNAFVNPIGGPIHTITMFTNPMMKKPSLNGSRVYYVEPGTDSVTLRTVSPSTYDTIYFKPGIHNIGMGQKIYPGKAIYIPGDAILYGSINNWDVAFEGFRKVGENITIFGYGTISGAKFPHPYYVLNPIDINHKLIAIDNPLNYKILGTAIVDPADLSVYTPSGVGGFLSYVKVIGWRANGDGLGNGDNVNDCFVRTNDDCSYVRGNRKRVTYWKDNISAIFYMSQIWETTPILIEDCDVLYCRSRGGGGAAWDMRADAPLGQRPAQATFRNIRFHDPLSNMEIFNLITYKGPVSSPTRIGGNYNWIKFENIRIKSSSVKSNLLGCAAAPWNGGLTFDNVTFAGTVLTQANFTNYFNTNQFVNNIMFNSRVNFNIATTVNGGFGGTATGGGAFALGESVTVSATPDLGYNFVNWTQGGVIVSTSRTYNFTVTQATNLVANFQPFNVTLPVEFLAFEALYRPNIIFLNWTTALEVNTASFVIERSRDGQVFIPIGTVKAKGSNAFYEFIDQTFLEGLNYYRLQINDFGGKGSYSNIISVVADNQISDIKIFPSIVSDNLIISSNQSNIFSFQIIDFAGQITVFKNYSSQNNNDQLKVDLSHLASGIYLIRVNNTYGGTSTLKFIKK